MKLALGGITEVQDRLLTQRTLSLVVAASSLAALMTACTSRGGSEDIRTFTPRAATQDAGAAPAAGEVAGNVIAMQARVAELQAHLAGMGAHPSEAAVTSFIGDMAAVMDGMELATRSGSLVDPHAAQNARGVLAMLEGVAAQLMPVIVPSGAGGTALPQMNDMLRLMSRMRDMRTVLDALPTQPPGTPEATASTTQATASP